jgi:hypothetical protein
LISAARQAQASEARGFRSNEILGVLDQQLECVLRVKVTNRRPARAAVKVGQGKDCLAQERYRARSETPTRLAEPACEKMAVEIREKNGKCSWLYIDCTAIERHS